MAQGLQIPAFWGVSSTKEHDSERREYRLRQWSPVKALDSPPWLRQAYDQLAKLSALPRDWDSYDADPVSIIALGQARLLFSNLDFEDIPEPHIAPTPDGGIGLHWRVGSRDLEIEISPTGEITFLQTRLEEASSFEDGVIHGISNVEPVLNWVISR